MAANKRGFVLYADQKLIFDDLTNDEAGILIKHIFSYVNDENPKLEDRLLDMAFKPIKLQLKRDLVKYQEVKEKRSLAGQKSAEIKKQQALTKSTSVENVEQGATKSTVIDNGNVNGNVINIVEQFFIDFENGSHIVEMSRIQKISIDSLKIKLKEFRTVASTEYVSYGKFIDHFRNWFLKNKEDKPVQTGSSIRLGRKS